MSMSFDRAVGYYDATRGYRPEVARAIGEAIAAAAAASPATRFLEIGIGTGRIALPVIARGHDFTGVDISDAMMDRLREKLVDLERESGQHTRATLLRADMLALPFADGQFDAVIAAHVFHLVADPDRAWQEALRVLRVDGPLLVCGDTSTSNEPVTIGETWRAIVRAEYGAIPSSTEAADQLIRAQIARDPRTRVDELRPVEWDYAVTPEQEMEAIRRRLWSNTWILPDDVFARCLARLEQWTAERYAGGMDVPVMRHAEFVILRVRRR